MAVITAGWFSLMARRAGRSMALWGLGGGCFALTLTTIVWGVGHAAAIPFSDADRVKFHIRWSVEAFVLIILIGWVPAFFLGSKRGSVPDAPAKA